ncbi:MAG: uL30 family ribosomal protein, partial [Fluviibacter sp.]
LGLGRLNSTAVLEDTPAVRGMIHKVQYLVKSESV